MLLHIRPTRRSSPSSSSFSVFFISLLSEIIVDHSHPTPVLRASWSTTVQMVHRSGVATGPGLPDGARLPDGHASQPEAGHGFGPSLTNDPHSSPARERMAQALSAASLARPPQKVWAQGAAGRGDTWCRRHGRHGRMMWQPRCWWCSPRLEFLLFHRHADLDELLTCCSLDALSYSSSSVATLQRPLDVR